MTELIIGSFSVLSYQAARIVESEEKKNEVINTTLYHLKMNTYLI